MKNNTKSQSWAVALTFVFISLVFTLTSFAQRPSPGSWDTSINPHDFTNLYYAQNGVIGKQIIWRRNGADGLSVFDNLKGRGVRVIATVPAFDQNGQPYFWYPLGELSSVGFTNDKAGFFAREMASHFPIYLFPDEKYIHFNTIANTRQAPLMDNSWASLWDNDSINPLGLRQIFLVNYNAKAFTPEGAEVMQYLMKKNGYATDKTPIIKTLEDMEILKKYECITIDDMGPTDTDQVYRATYAIAPVIANPTKGVIARDAFLYFSTKDGNPLESEMIFVNQFKCLQQLGDWCF
jgi:hypothetical protein